MIHQPSGGAQGTAADIEIQAREILYLRVKMNELYAKHTGQPVEPIERDMDRDRFMSAEEAKAYGLIDNVVHAPRRAGEPCVPAARTAKIRGRTSTLDLVLDRPEPLLGPSTRLHLHPRPRGSMSHDKHLRCSFCGKSKDSVRKFISGPSVYICNECIALCNEILAEDEEREVAEAITQVPTPHGDQGRPRPVRDRAGAGEEGAGGRGLQPLQAHQRHARRGTTTSSWTSRTSCSSARPASARRCWRRRSPASSTCPSPSPTPRR